MVGADFATRRGKKIGRLRACRFFEHSLSN